MGCREPGPRREMVASRCLEAPGLSSEPRCPSCDQPLSGAERALPPSLVAARLDDASLVLLAFAYSTSALALLTGLVPLVATSLGFEWKVLTALAGALAGAILFVTLKYAS